MASEHFMQKKYIGNHRAENRKKVISITTEIFEYIFMVFLIEKGRPFISESADDF